MAKIGRDIEELREIFGIVGSGGGVGELNDDSVSLVYDVGRLVGGAFTDDDPSGEPYSCRMAFAAGGAGVMNRVQLRNPVNSDTIVRLELIRVHSTTDHSFAMELRQTAVDLASAGIRRNRRMPSRGGQVAIVSGEAAAGSGLTGAYDSTFAVAAAGMRTEHWRYEIGPGHAFYAAQETGNITLACVIWWREASLK